HDVYIDHVQLDELCAWVSEVQTRPESEAAANEPLQYSPQWVSGATPIRVKSCHVPNGDIFVNKREKNYPFNSATCTIPLLRKNFSSGASHLDNQFQKQWAKLLFFL